MKYAPVKVPGAARFPHQDHTGDMSSNSYYRPNNIAKKLLQDVVINTADKANKCNSRPPPSQFTPPSTNHHPTQPVSSKF